MLQRMTGPVFALVLCLSTAAPDALGADVTLKGAWWRGPAARTRRTTLVATFDSAKGHDADFARGMALAGGFGMQADAPGKHGRGACVAEKGGHLHFRGSANVNLNRGTVRLLVRGDVWRDKTARWLWEARGTSFLGVERSPGKLSLVVREGRFARQPVSRIDLPVDDVSVDQWHSVVASWDRASGEGLVALDGRGVRAKLKLPAVQGPVLVLYVGGGFGARAGGMNLSGLALDELAVYDLPAWMLEATAAKRLPAKQQALLLEAEAGARKCLDRIVSLQRWGGWRTIHTWPTLIPSSAQGREWVDFPDTIGNDKSHATPRIGARLLWAYEVLGDYAYLEAALRTAEFLLAAQDKDGFWVHGYRMTVHGIEPLAGRKHIKLQDSVQSHPIFFLAYLHRLTGDDRYLAAMKRAGGFYLKAQNPNGSWSHHYDADAGIGLTARNAPQGGELNDLCMNDAIDVMALLAHITGDRKYVEAMKRAGQWLIDAQLKGATRGWADQYHKDNSPAWARHFEPPACSRAGTCNACRALVEVYRFSGDDRYLQPIRECLAWIKRAFPDGKMWNYLDVTDGRPVAAWRRKVYHMDDPKDGAWLRTQPISSSTFRAHKTMAWVKRRIDRAARPAPEAIVPTLTRKTALEGLASLGKRAQSALDTQHESGMWVVPNVASFMGSVGAGFSTFSPRVQHLLRYAEAARVALGELPPGPRPQGHILRLAWPKADWYDVGWNR